MLNPPEQQTFPQIAVNITPDGMMITILLAPGTAITQALGEEQMNTICQKWLETRKQIKQELNIIDLVQRSKIK